MVSKLNKIMYKLLILIVITLVFSSVISAFGVTPARNIVDYDNGLDFSNHFIVKNNENRPMQVAIDVQGELAKYVTLNSVILNFKQGELEKKVDYKIKIPAGVDLPGDNDINFVLLQLPPEGELGTYVGARLSLITSVRVRIPYPGQYIKLGLDVTEGDAGGNVVFVLSPHNLGTEVLESVSGTIKVKGPFNNEIVSFDTSEVTLQPGKRKELIVVWDTEVNPGNYVADAVVNYGGKKAESSSDFSVGDSKIILKDLKIGSFNLGEIAEFEISISNQWNEDFENVYANVQIYDLDGNLVGEFKTPTTDVKSKRNEKLLGYLNTKNIEEGEYVTKVILHYGGKTLEREVKTVISSSGAKTYMKSTGKAIALSGLDYTFNSVFMIGLVILIIINIMWFIYFRRRKVS